MATGSVNGGKYVSSTIVTNFTVRRSGDVVFVSCVGGNYTVDSNNNMMSGTDTLAIPSGFKPAATTNVWETNVGTRVQFSMDGSIKVTGGTGALRFSACWITTDAYP